MKKIRFKGRYEDDIRKIIFSSKAAELTDIPQMNDIIQMCFFKVSEQLNTITPNYIVVHDLKKLRLVDKGYDAFSTAIDEIICKYNQNDFDSGALGVNIDIIRSVTLKMAMIVGNMNEMQVLEFCFALHKKKNESYNDGWYYKGSYGVFLDLHRKVYRLNSIIFHKNEPKVENENFFDTIVDTFNYSCLLFVALLKMDQLL